MYNTVYIKIFVVKIFRLLNSVSQIFVVRTTFSTKTEYEIKMCVCGYQKVWEAAVKETLVRSREARIHHDRYAVAVEKK